MGGAGTGLCHVHDASGLGFAQPRGPRDHINTRILQNMISGIPLILGLGARM